MDYSKLNIDTWKDLNRSGNLVSGYNSVWLSLEDKKESNLHIFKDESGHFHFAIEAEDVGKNDIEDPSVNGLHIGLFSYRFENGKVGQFIDLKCDISGYLGEFTEVVKEIAKTVLEKGEPPVSVVNQVIRNWISFWANQRKEILNEDKQIGLICELIALNNLCKISPDKALMSWKGPLGEKHDFNFTDWAFEVKGTRKSDRTHIVNGIDQLKPPDNKRLAFLSFQVTIDSNNSSINLPDLINAIVNEHFTGKPDLTIGFNDLLAGAGYSPVYAEEYRRFNIDILESTVFEVNDSFPKLTSDMLKEPLNSRVSSISYNISIADVQGTDLDKITWGDYFY